MLEIQGRGKMKNVEVKSKRGANRRLKIEDVVCSREKNVES